MKTRNFVEMNYLKKSLFIFLLCITLIIPNSYAISTEGLENSNFDQSNFSLQLNLNDDRITVGDDLDIEFGLLDENSNHVAGYQYVLVLINSSDFNSNFDISNNSSYITLSDGTTSASLMSYRVRTNSVADLTPRDYVILFQVEGLPGEQSTQRKAVLFSLVADIDLNVVFTKEPEDLVLSDRTFYAELDTTNNISIEIFNYGPGNITDFVFDLSYINGPLDSTAVAVFPIEKSVISPGTSLKVFFTVTPPHFGISKMIFIMSYNESSTLTRSSTYNFKIYTLPDITGIIFLPDKLVKGENAPIDIQIANPELDYFNVEFRLNSPKLSFTPNEILVEKLRPGKSTFSFSSLIFENGSSIISLIMTYNDPIGGDSLNIELQSTSIEILAAPDDLPNESFNWTFLALAIPYVLIFIVILILYFNHNLRKVILNSLIGHQKYDDVNYSSDKVVIDGSNVAWDDLTVNNKPKVENILKIISAVSNYGFKEVIVVVDAALRYQIEDPKNLDKQVKKGIIKVLPAKVDGDTFILRISRDTGAMILSNDLFKEFRDEFPWIDQRRIPYTIIGEEVYLHPVYKDEIEEDQTSN